MVSNVKVFLPEKRTFETSTRWWGQRKVAALDRRQSVGDVGPRKEFQSGRDELSKGANYALRSIFLTPTTEFLDYSFKNFDLLVVLPVLVSRTSDLWNKSRANTYFNFWYFLRFTVIYLILTHTQQLWKSKYVKCLQNNMQNHAQRHSNKDCWTMIGSTIVVLNLVVIQVFAPSIILTAYHLKFSYICFSFQSNSEVLKTKMAA